MTTTATRRQDLTVPADKAARDELRRAVQAYCSRVTMVPPLALDEIEAHADHLIRELHLDPSLRGFVTVLVGNGVWHDTVAAIPFDRRILLLPQCLRSSTACPASFDALGLLCEECGRCGIGTIQKEAEELGYTVLVAEGTTAVSELLSRGEADTVVGVSCMEALEKSFAPLTVHAIPGLAVPLLRNGCVDTPVDLDWIREVLHLKDPKRTGAARLDMQALRREVSDWFEPHRLQAMLNLSGTETETIAVEWLGKDGKRWRPTLAVCVFKALTDPGREIPEAMKKVAVAIECFHKASLVHDDIEDDDDLRYDTPTLHRQHGVEVAINTGDLLIGEGYRLIAGSGASAEQIVLMLAVAAEGHRTLCLGQGTELLLRQTPERLTVAGAIDILRRKTAPAYEVALQLGAIFANAPPDTRAILTAFSEALGVAYQIRDDLDDVAPGHTPSAAQGHPFLLMALAREELQAGGKSDAPAATLDQIKSTSAEQRARELLRHYEQQALQSLRPLRHAALKSLLHRIVAKILNPPPS